jgi:hypothetical protein
VGYVEDEGAGNGKEFFVFGNVCFGNFATVVSVYAEVYSGMKSYRHLCLQQKLSNPQAQVWGSSECLLLQ